MARDFKYYEMLEKIPGIVTDYLNGLTRKQICEKTGLNPKTVSNYLFKSDDAIRSIYGIKAKEKIEEIQKQRVANIKTGVIKIDMRRIATAEKGKSK